MTSLQRTVKYIAQVFAVFLCVCIIGGIFGVLTSLSFLFGKKEAPGEMKSYSFGRKIENLDIDVSAADLTLKSGKSFYAESNSEYLTVKEKNGTLEISEKKKPFRSYEGSAIIIYLPRDIRFGRVKISAGAGAVDIDRLAADRVSLNLGAGRVNIDSLKAEKSADIEGGAGNITVGGELNDFDFDMGVGEFNFKGRLSGSCELDMGVGSSDLTLIGTPGDYCIDVNKGLGEITVDGKKLSDGELCGSGSSKISVDGGVGEIKIGFAKAA